MVDPELLARRVRADQFSMFMTWAFRVLHPGRALVVAPYLLATCFAMEEFAHNRRQLQLVVQPPRHLKSITGPVALAAWMLGRDPTLKIVVASYGAVLYREHMSLFRKLVEHPEFRRMFPRFKIARATNDEVTTTLGGCRRGTSPEGAITGIGADVIIIDDLIKASDAYSAAMREKANAFFDNTLYSRLNDKADARILVVSQRLHENDIIGHLRTKAQWDELVFPAIAEGREVHPTYFGRSFIREKGDILSPARENAETLEQTRLMMGDPAFSAQYQQQPIPPGGNRVRWDWFEAYPEEPEEFRDRLRREMRYVVQSWDTAMKETPDCDYSACATLGSAEGETWFLLDMVRKRVRFAELCDLARTQRRRWRPDAIIVENACNGDALVQELKKRRPGEGGRQAQVQLWNPLRGKEERVEVYSAQLQAGDVLLPEAAPWLAEFRHELLGFPNATHDDQVDALFQFLEWRASRRGRSLVAIDPETGRKLPHARPQGSQYARTRSGRR